MKQNVISHQKLSESIFEALEKVYELDEPLHGADVDHEEFLHHVADRYKSLLASTQMVLDKILAD